jgi:hypothetical protein
MCWHAPIQPGCAFRRLQPSIPIETSHLFRMKPAGHSDDPSRLRCGSQADEFGLLNGLFVKLGFGGAQFSHRFMSALRLLLRAAPRRGLGGFPVVVCGGYVVAGTGFEPVTFRL